MGKSSNNAAQAVVLDTVGSGPSTTHNRTLLFSCASDMCDDMMRGLSEMDRAKARESWDDLACPKCGGNKLTVQVEGEAGN
ncbi:MAG: hypothetical protein J4F28_02175 [Nitrosopumilaceae archaeon]|nr:hypothetical protein [Nitrosopumilaceae archaeon]